MPQRSRQFVSIASMAVLLFAGFVSSVHFHGSGDCCDHTTQKVTHFDCGCPIPGATDHSSDESTPSHDDCVICKLLANFTAEVQTGFELTVDSTVGEADDVAEAAILVSFSHVYQGRGPPCC